MPLPLPQLDADPEAPFPPVATARREPDGLLAVGGDLSPARLLNAYRNGIFPWFSHGQPILWWSPDPRMLFRTNAVRLSTRTRRALRSSRWIVRADTRFDQVIAACASVPRAGQGGTWITLEMRDAYSQLHRLGHAHSVEVYESEASGARLLGGMYGIAIGRMFFAESMVSVVTGGSKVALAALAWRLSEWRWPLIDAQVESAHLQTLGAESVPRQEFLNAIAPLCEAGDAPAGSWAARFGALPASALAG